MWVVWVRMVRGDDCLQNTRKGRSNDFLVNYIIRFLTELPRELLEYGGMELQLCNY